MVIIIGNKISWKLSFLLSESIFTFCSITFAGVEWRWSGDDDVSGLEQGIIKKTHGKLAGECNENTTTTIIKYQCEQQQGFYNVHIIYWVQLQTWDACNLITAKYSLDDAVLMLIIPMTMPSLSAENTERFNGLFSLQSW